MASQFYTLYGRFWWRFPRDCRLCRHPKERIAMAFLGSTRHRPGRASLWVAGTTALSLGVFAGAYWAPQSATAAGLGGGAVASPIPRGATVLPDGRYVRPAGLRYN